MCNNRLPAVFDSYFIKTSKIHKYNKTRLSTRQAYALPITRTDYGIFSMKFTEAKIWNEIVVKDLKTLYMKTVKAKLKKKFTLNY